MLAIDVKFDTRRSGGVFQKLLTKTKRDGKIKAEAGYDGGKAPYAAYVHERTELHHPAPTQAKFLEEAFDNVEQEMLDAIAEAIYDGKPLKTGVKRALKILKDESQRLVPVLTGNLKNSWYARILES